MAQDSFQKEVRSFSEEVKEKLCWYVYRLIDPRNGETFYVGKGRGNRVFEHARGVVGEMQEQGNDPKKQRISEIRASRLQVAHIIHRHGMPEEIALEVEAALIDAYPGLTNKVTGHGSGERGSRHAEEIISEHEAEIFEATESFILLSPGNLWGSDDPYRVVQGFWKTKKERAENYKLVLAQVGGLVKVAYRPEKWLDATRENFPDNRRMTKDNSERCGFKGQEAEPEVLDRYVGKRVPDKYLGSQNPVRYCDL